MLLYPLENLSDWRAADASCDQVVRRSVLGLELAPCGCDTSVQNGLRGCPMPVAADALLRDMLLTLRPGRAAKQADKLLTAHAHQRTV